MHPAFRRLLDDRRLLGVTSAVVLSVVLAVDRLRR
jgi:hypothetical protein